MLKEEELIEMVLSQEPLLEEELIEVVLSWELLLEEEELIELVLP